MLKDWSMPKWLKGIGIVTAAVIGLELVAWVGIALLGEDFVDKMKEVYLPKPPPVAVEKDLGGGGVEKCSTYDGKIFCITENEHGSGREIDATEESELSQEAGSAVGEKCSDFEGEVICIREDQ